MAPVYLQADITLDVSECLGCNSTFAFATCSSHYFALVWPRAKILLDELVKTRERLRMEADKLEKQRDELQERKRQTEENIRVLQEQREQLVRRAESHRRELEESRNRRERLEGLQGGLDALKTEWDTINTQDPGPAVYARRLRLNESIERLKRQVYALEADVDIAAAAHHPVDEDDEE